MNIQLINTGRELMLGRVLNTHQQWLCRQLAERGFVVNRQVAVDDSAAAIQQAVREALDSADLIITTGGLGPTGDDRTRDLVAQLLGRTLHEDSSVVAHIESFFTARKRTCPERVKVQAQVPEGAVVLSNQFGTAPGLVLEATSPARRSPVMLVMLPGPPRELRPMFLHQALPRIQTRFPHETPFACRVLRTTGLGESLVEEKLTGPLETLLPEGLDVGYCARPGEVDVQLVVRGPKASDTVARAEIIVRQQIGDLVFGMEEERLEDVVIRELTAQKKSLALAESCTGGYIAHRLTNVPGASAVFLASLVTYANQTKQACLGVESETLARFGAVSEETARAMASGARRQTGADLALAVTGIAGPSGGSAEKPVGTVYIALATSDTVKAARFQNPYDRETFKYVTSQQALEWIRRALSKTKGP